MLQGLNSFQASTSLKQFGFNELPTAPQKNIFKIVTEIIKEPMFLLLLACGLIYIIIGDYREGVILLSATILIIFITFYQYQKTERALEKLKNLSSPRALVLRNGVQIRIAGREVVPEDLLVLNEGDRIAADAKLIKVTNLFVDESLLTGESNAVKKSSHVAEEALVYSGTLVIRGNAIAKVFATGVNTSFGKIGSTLHTISASDTPLQIELKLLIKKLFIIGIVISASVIVAFYFSRGNLVASILNGLSTSMAILPEEFPVVLTVFLAIGAWRLSNQKVLTRKPSAIETLGATTTLCADKTGTITQNKMQIALLYEGNQIISYNSFKNEKNKIVGLINAAYWASQTNSIDPMEKSIRETFEEIAIVPEAHFKLVKAYSISHDLPIMTHVFEKPNDNNYYLYAKGAPETLFELCKLRSDEKEKYELVLNEMAGSAYRVIAVAESVIVKNELPKVQSAFSLQFKGLIAFEDPIRPEVPKAIKECVEAGIKVIVITGDFPLTAKAIGKKIGLPQNGAIITGEELDNLNDSLLRERIASTTIFARVVPMQKLRIVNVLKANNEIVAMTGDGVNDAPALKAAHIGIAMGGRGTDVAREASSLVLLDDNFTSIVSAIRLGRKIFDNLQKAMSYILAIHVPIIGLTLLPALFSNIPLLLMPLHIVFLELIIDPVCSVAFESEMEEKGIMNRPPRRSNEKFFGTNKLLVSLLKGLLLLVMLVYLLTLNEGHNEHETRAIVFTSLVIGNVILIVSSLSNSKNVIAVLLEGNYKALLLLVLPVISLAVILTVPAAQRIFSFENPGIGHFALVFSLACIFLLILESIKYYLYKKNKFFLHSS